jgi:DNA-directed RNA polymerase beta subunit
MKRIELSQDVDDYGELDEFTWDLFPVVDLKHTQHLDGSGLPKVGTIIKPGMIVIGKIGKTAAYDSNKQPSALEIHGLPFEVLFSKYGNMWKDLSIYANEELSGAVKRAYFEKPGDRLRAIVELDDPDRGNGSR